MPLSLTPEMLGDARPLWSASLFRRVSVPTTGADDGEWALVYDNRYRWAYEGKLPPPDEDGHVYPVFRQTAYVLACRLAEVGEDPTPERVGALLLNSWRLTDKGSGDFERALMGCCDGVSLDYSGSFDTVPEPPDRAIDAVCRVKVATSKRGQDYSLESPPQKKKPEEFRAWLLAVLDRARGFGSSNADLYYAAKDVAPSAGLSLPQLWALVSGLGPRGMGARRHRAAALARRSALASAGTLGDAAPVVLESARVNYILDFTRHKYRPIHQARGARPFEQQLLVASASMPDPYPQLVQVYLTGEPEEKAEAERLLFAQADDGPPILTFLGDRDPTEFGLGRWVSPGVYQARDLVSGVSPHIDSLYVPEVDVWLRTLGGTEAERLLDWLAVVGDTSIPCCALAFVGEGNAGKSLFGRALSCLFGGVAQIADKTGTYHDGLDKSHILSFDEGIVGMESGRFRQLLTSREHSVNLKGKSIVQVDGHYRVVISANDVSKILPESTSFSTQAGDAIAQRLLVITVGPEVRDAALLAVAGCDRVLGSAAHYDRRPEVVARHLRWLMETRKDAVMQRWQGSTSQQLVVTGGNLDAMRVELAVRAGHEAYSTLEAAIRKGWTCHDLDEGLLVPSMEEGRSIVDSMYWNDGGSAPKSTVQRRLVLRDAWGEPVRRQVGGQRVRGYIVPWDQLKSANINTSEESD